MKKIELKSDEIAKKILNGLRTKNFNRDEMKVLLLSYALKVGAVTTDVLDGVKVNSDKMLKHDEGLSGKGLISLGPEFLSEPKNIMADVCTVWHELGHIKKLNDRDLAGFRNFYLDHFQDLYANYLIESFAGAEVFELTNAQTRANMEKIKSDEDFALYAKYGEIISEKKTAVLDFFYVNYYLSKEEKYAREFAHKLAEKFLFECISGENFSEDEKKVAQGLFQQYTQNVNVQDKKLENLCKKAYKEQNAPIKNACRELQRFYFEEQPDGTCRFDNLPMVERGLQSVGILASSLLVCNPNIVRKALCECYKILDYSEYYLETIKDYELSTIAVLVLTILYDTPIELTPKDEAEIKKILRFHLHQSTITPERFKEEKLKDNEWV